MGFNPAVRDVSTYENEDRRWLATQKGYDSCRSITLDVSTFQAGHLTETGAIPSGVMLGIITASGKYGPYDTDGSDGREVARGYLLTSVVLDTGVVGTASDCGAALCWEGIINQDYLPDFTVTGNEGKTDSAARTDLAASMRFEGTAP